ncbi:LOW QUALITY PROTEIN: F-box/WD repeat-containing protein 5-like [Actinia tenebrosa]|uniref:LOW QUALITY PROTEIN: F-box/WD repeat-containing protein 5-like n=1 Tax=Actinia tenebrosa TaxID=6105 RepID=A0A6P8HQX9_ACTTE|nr:LOW QUALITY PROTEIN: F-box/WD repeat-containing protein 5-like [Actinia tenebrosa]
MSLEGVNQHQLMVDFGPMESPFLPWMDIPDSLLLHILSFLPPKDVVIASRVCTKWHRTATDEMLWKELFTFFFGSTGTTGKCFKLPSFSSSWLQEFQRLYSETPLIETQVLEGHSDEVLHVAFSHDGKLFASSSKDCLAIIWEIIDGEVKVKRTLDFRKYRWEYVQFCEFSKDDTLLLVSGINERRRLNFMGEITICSIDGKDDQTILHNVISEPYDVFGAWLSETHFISGSFEFRVPFYDSSVSELWANSIHGRNPVRLCRVLNENGSSVRNVLVAKPAFLKENELLLIFTHGVVTYIPHQIVINKITTEKDNDTFRILPQSNIGNKNRVSEKFRLSIDPDSDSDDDAEDVRFTEPDHLIETNAHIIGVGLAPDQDMLYVNCRPWIGERKAVQQRAAQWGIHEEFEISSDIHTRVYSLSSLELLKEHVGHRAFTPNDKCFFIFLDVADKLVASGAEDCCAHVWDRHYGFKLATLEGHSDVVNCVAFNPQNPEMLISASDDQTLRVWKSRRKAK